MNLESLTFRSMVVVNIPRHIVKCRIVNYITTVFPLFFQTGIDLVKISFLRKRLPIQFFEWSGKIQHCEQWSAHQKGYDKRNSPNVDLKDSPNDSGKGQSNNGKYKSYCKILCNIFFVFHQIRYQFHIDSKISGFLNYLLTHSTRKVKNFTVISNYKGELL